MNYGAEPADETDLAHQCHRHRMFAAEEPAAKKSSKPETGKDDTTVEGNGQVPPGQTEGEGSSIVTPGSNVMPSLNRGKHINNPVNPNRQNSPGPPNRGLGR